ncbi:MAG: PorT family protein [Pedobacter sp.]|nr:MAG: PorT family protein [Pedobacter sp.]
MKKVLLSILLAAGLITVGYAQNNPVKFGVKAGVAIPHLTLSAMGASINFDSKFSYYLGGTADISVSKFFSVQPGLTFINKGSKINGSGFDFEDVSEEGTNGSFNFSYIEIPVNLIAKFDAGNAGKVFIGAGPYYAFAIDANGKIDGEKEDITIGSNDDDLKRGDFGVNFLGGYQFNKGLNIHAGYGLGLSSIIADQEFDVKLKNRVFTFGLGFTF